MKLVMTLILLLGAILAFLYLCKKMGIDVNAVLTAIFDKRGSQQAQPVEQYQSLTKSHGVEYESFAYLFWVCLDVIGQICGLDCPNSVVGIYCPKIADRVRILNGQITFLYEVPVMNTTAIRNGKIDTKKIDVQKIKEILAENLPDYMDGGYSCSRNIHVWPIDQNRVRIEVQGINRTLSGMEGIII